jgi:hypothetical protein
MRWLSLCMVMVLLCGLSLQAADPPSKVPLSDEVRAELTKAIVDLRGEVTALQGAPARVPQTFMRRVVQTPLWASGCEAQEGTAN